MAKDKEPPPEKPKKKSWLDRWNDKVDDINAKTDARDARKRGQGKDWKGQPTEEEKEAAKKQMKRRADHQMYSVNPRGVKHSYVDCYCGLSADHER